MRTRGRGLRIEATLSLSSLHMEVICIPLTCITATRTQGEVPTIRPQVPEVEVGPGVLIREVEGTNNKFKWPFSGHLIHHYLSAGRSAHDSNKFCVRAVVPTLKGSRTNAVVFMRCFLQKLAQIQSEKVKETYFVSTYNLLRFCGGSTNKCSQ